MTKKNDHCAALSRRIAAVRADNAAIRQERDELVQACRFALERFGISDSQWAKETCARLRAAIATGDQQ